MSMMCDEIRQQPNALERTLAEEWPRAEQLRRHFEQHPVDLIILVARGTSDNAAQFGRYLLEICTGIPVSLAAPSVYTLYRASVRMRNTAVVAISQSGESTDTNLVLEQAKSAGAFTVGITNEPGSTLARLADHAFLVRAGKEQSVAATKTYTGQLLCFYLLAHAFGAAITHEDLVQIPGWAAAALETEKEVSRRAERYAFMQHAVCIGRGLNYSNSFEFALKLMETCYVVAERFSSADLLHGPIAMLSKSFPAFLFCPSGVTWKSTSELLLKLESLKAETLLITDRSNSEASSRDGIGEQTPIVIPAQLRGRENLADDLFTPIPYVIPASTVRGESRRSEAPRSRSPSDS